MAAKKHYMEFGKKENRDCSCPKEACDRQCYLNRNPDLVNAFGKDNVVAAKDHYYQWGWKEGRDCGCPGQGPPNKKGFHVAGIVIHACYTCGDLMKFQPGQKCSSTMRLMWNEQV